MKQVFGFLALLALFSPRSVRRASHRLARGFGVTRLRLPPVVRRLCLLLPLAMLLVTVQYGKRGGRFVLLGCAPIRRLRQDVPTVILLTGGHAGLVESV